jgi:hypothetical protein
METQYLEIRAARKQIFSFDILIERGSNIIIEDNLSDERINWDVREPEIYPEENQFREYFRNSSSGGGGDDGDDGNSEHGDDDQASSHGPVSQDDS